MFLAMETPKSKKVSNTCYKCKENTLTYSPEGHEQYPYLCTKCGTRWSAEIPWWKDTLPEILWIMLWVAIGVGGLLWIMFNPFGTWWSFAIGMLGVAYGAAKIITRTHICF